ncbi:MAG: hypothetical protein QM488_18500 [Rhizobiaceae bacterium]
MTALTKDRATAAQLGDNQEHPVLAATIVYGGSIACLNAAGWLVPGATATTLTTAGRCESRADNSAGANGDINVQVKKGIFPFANSAAADEITRAEIGDDCYIVDDQTVAKTDGTSTRSVAGKIVQLDSHGVWVALGI